MHHGPSSLFQQMSQVYLKMNHKDGPTCQKGPKDDCRFFVLCSQQKNFGYFDLSRVRTPDYLRTDLVRADGNSFVNRWNDQIKTKKGF